MGRRSGSGSRPGAQEESNFTARLYRLPRPESLLKFAGSEFDESPDYTRFRRVPGWDEAVYREDLHYINPRRLRISYAPHSRGFGTGTSQAKRFFPAERFSMRVPERVRFCVRRKERREVLFALGRAGFSGSARKRKWIRKESSNWRC